MMNVCEIDFPSKSTLCKGYNYLVSVLDNSDTRYLELSLSQVIGWLAHSASHSPLNPRVNNAVGSNPTC